MFKSKLKSSFDVTIEWTNQDEYQRLLKNIAEAGQAFQRALDELNEYEALLDLKGSVVKGEENEQANEKEETAGA